jgi:hypothetical protein
MLSLAPCPPGPHTGTAHRHHLPPSLSLPSPPFSWFVLAKHNVEPFSTRPQKQRRTLDLAFLALLREAQPPVASSCSFEEAAARFAGEARWAALAADESRRRELFGKYLLAAKKVEEQAAAAADAAFRVGGGVVRLVEWWWWRCQWWYGEGRGGGGGTGRGGKGRGFDKRDRRRGDREPSRAHATSQLLAELLTT